MSHTKPYVRKKAVSAMFKLFMRYPQGLRLTFERLKERLADGEASVVSCAVNIVCELANKNPNNYLSMAPQVRARHGFSRGPGRDGARRAL